MKISECLREMHDLIETKGWTQGAMARDAKGHIVPPDSSEATCFCLLGALDRVLDYENRDPDADPSRLYRSTLAFMERALGCEIDEFNDYELRTEVSILAKLDKLVDIAEKEEEASK